MPNCDPRCPVVKKQIRKIAIGSPWVLKERVAAGDRTAAALFQTVNDKFATGRFDSKPEEERTISISTHYDRQFKDQERRIASGKRVDGTQTPTDSIRTGKEEIVATGSEHPSYRSALGKRKETSATQWSDAKEGFDGPFETDVTKQIVMHTTDFKGEFSELDDENDVDRADKKDGTDRIDKANGTDRIDGVDRMDETDRASRMDKETLKQEFTDATGLQTDDMDRGSRSDDADATDRTIGTGEPGKAHALDKEVLKKEAADEVAEFAMFRDECEPSCPRRISRKSRIRKLEEVQRIVDFYLLNKGTRYFDDVCTCSLSCVLRALRRDPFVTSTLASVALFTLGLKLCSELNAWYLPIRFS